MAAPDRHDRAADGPAGRHAGSSGGAGSGGSGSGGSGGGRGRGRRTGRGAAPSGTRGAGAASSSRGRTRARQGPRRDPQRVVRRRHPLRVPSGPAAAAARARRAAAATGGALGLSTARRAAVLAVVVCALALTVAVPLRNYVTQRHEIAAVAAEQERLARDVATLTDERAALRDPAHIEALARERLGYARPGEVPYRVELPGDANAPRDPRDAGSGAELPPAEADLPWYARVARTTLGTAP
ncbi:FtsB family cell division protein [Actinomycetospora sp. NBC_00405]|uniref:FtsB family cell division protein n=1 Tax=Actinomycetospora sp. NBC_00405 TaxID=2975952 RepID=UPI002E23989B